MFDLGWTELLVIGVVALIVVGPKDLPVLFRKAGQFMGKAKGMAREFSRAMNEAADEAGVSDIQKTIRTATNPVGKAMDGVKDAARSIADPLADLKESKDSGDAKADDPDAARKAEQAKKIHAASARAAADRKKREAEEAVKKAEAAEAALKGDDTGPAA
ncbi:MAG: twin-arginine translocase subunit TatB [Rhodobacteraceae bacterium]|nr:MAG: twin-arginine translocase subunit TatB [Paracoccaceae bacterium]